MNADFRYEDHGSVALIVPLNDIAHDVLENRVSNEAQWWGDGLVVEPRYVGPILEDLDADGFTIEDGRGIN